MHLSSRLSVAVIALGGALVHAQQYPYLDSAYVQEIYTGPLVGGPGMAWTSSNNLLTRNGADIIEYSPTQNTVYQGTNLHGSIITHTITGLQSSGYGLANGTDGYIYAVTGFGLQRFNPNNWAAPAQSLAGTVGGQGYGITALADGRIAYIAGANTDELYIYNPFSNTNTLIYTNGSLIDDITSDAAGNIALAGQVNSNIIIVSSTGSVINNFSTPHFPDGLAFGDGVAANTTLFSNNNDGTISKYVLGANYSGTPVITDIATGSQAYGDLSAVGPDCAFYVSQFDNGGYHGCTPGVGTNWANSVTTNEPSIIRISLKSGECGFYHNEAVPEPSSLLVIGGALFGLRLKKRKH